MQVTTDTAATSLNSKGENWDFDFTASHAGEYIIEMGDCVSPDGTMETYPPGWRQTEY